MEASKQKPRRRLWQALQPIGDIHWGGGWAVGEAWSRVCPLHSFPPFCFHGPFPYRLSLLHSLGLLEALWVPWGTQYYRKDHLPRPLPQVCCLFSNVCGSQESAGKPHFQQLPFPSPSITCVSLCFFFFFFFHFLQGCEIECWLLID